MNRVLIIEDDPVVRQLVVTALDRHNFGAASANNGEAGLKMIREYQPHLVLCDIVLPDTTGFDVYQKATKDGLTTSLPFIFLTAVDNQDAHRRAMALGVDDYITKPFSTRDLIAAVEARLKKYEKIEERHTRSMKMLKHSISYALPHELRTPLGAILGYALILQEDADKVKSAEIKEWTTRILASTNRLQHVIENYLVYIQLETADTEQQAAMRRNILADAKPIITSAARSVAEKHNRQSDLKLQVASVALRITDEDLRKIVGELVDNAFKFSAAGTPVTVAAKRENKQYMIGIADKGRGMSAEQVANMGEYMQFDRKIYEQKGIGLGYAVARRLIEVYGGTLTIKSEPKKGTRIKVSLPS